MNPIIIDDKKCPNCENEISEWNFIGSSLESAVIDKESGAITFEVETKCFMCGERLWGLLWLVEINEESKYDKDEKDF